MLTKEDWANPEGLMLAGTDHGVVSVRCDHDGSYEVIFDNPVMDSTGYSSTDRVFYPDGTHWFGDLPNIVRKKVEPKGGFPYIVFSPTGAAAPRKEHETLEAAEQEANRLSANHRGQVFYTMQAVSKSFTAPPTRPATETTRLYS